MKRLTLTIADRSLCNDNAFYVRNLWGKELYIIVERTPSHKLTLKDKMGKTYDKCSMSNWFKSYDYFAIYWDKSTKDEMINTIICELRNELNR